MQTTGKCDSSSDEFRQPNCSRSCTQKDRVPTYPTSNLSNDSKQSATTPADKQRSDDLQLRIEL